MAKTKNLSQAADNPLADQLSELGIETDADGRGRIRMLATVSTDDFNAEKDDICSCDPQLAVRLVRRGYAEPYVECSPTA